MATIGSMKGGSRQEPARGAGSLMHKALSLALVLGAALIASVIAFQFRTLWLPDMTEYATGFSAEKWNRINVGMSEDEVTSVLGYPLEITERGKEGVLRVRHLSGSFQDKQCYYNLSPAAYDPAKIESIMFKYSRPGKWLDSYNMRLLKIDPTRRVIEKVTAYYND